MCEVSNIYFPLLRVSHPGTDKDQPYLASKAKQQWDAGCYVSGMNVPKFANWEKGSDSKCQGRISKDRENNFLHPYTIHLFSHFEIISMQGFVLLLILWGLHFAFNIIIFFCNTKNVVLDLRSLLDINGTKVTHSLKDCTI